MSERELQIECAKWLDSQGWLWFHPTSEGKRSGRYGAGLKTQGMKRGLPDILIFEPWEDGCVPGFGVAIELKTKRGRLKKEQRQWLTRLEARGWLTNVCRSLDEVVKTCRVL